tara:strand:+ start:5453 stop:7366 length:1914 start_codon:yes stop_codon:yes gene_type:complete
MADVTFNITVASGALYTGGTGNVYYIDGVRSSTGPGTITWQPGKSYRFEQSDSTNDGHPLIFSSTTAQANYLTSDVTYYLDGATTYANYVNTTNFNAATTRYVEVTPTSATSFYYLCYIHGIGMGGIMDRKTQLTYTVTVATGDLYLGGGAQGNVYYLDGVRDIDLSWVKSGALRFDQSASTNNNHPLFFATQTSNPQSNVYSTGVTYFLDGAVSQSTYTNTTNFNAATVRYVEVAPASDDTFYYACWVHGIGMGGEIDITQQTYGALSWNVGQWGEQDKLDIDVTGLQLGSSLGDTVQFPDRGWGGNTWSHGNWGEVSQTDVAVSGSQLQSSINDVIPFPEFGWGGGVWNSSKGGWGDLANVQIDATGSQLQTNIGEEGTEGEINAGWGRKTWNNNEGWGISGTLQADGIQLQTTTPGVEVDAEINVGWGRLEWGNGAWNVGYSVELGSLSLQSNVGEESAFTDFVVEQSGLSIQSTVGDAHETTADSDVAPFGVQAQTSQGEAVGAQDVDPTLQSLAIQSSVGPVEVGALTLINPDGIQLQSNIGEESAEGFAIVNATGIGMAFLSPSADAVSVAEATGSQLQTSVSGPQEINGNATVDLTGIQLTGSLGSLNITPWNEVDLGVNNTWTEVDLAA